MIPVPRRVFQGSFEWYGLSLTVEGSHFSITSGRIGTYSNPIQVNNGKLEGGWYIPPTRINLSPEISRIDILCREREAFVMFRSSDNAERYPDEFTLLLSLAWKEGEQWYVETPKRVD